MSSLLSQFLDHNKMESSVKDVGEMFNSVSHVRILETLATNVTPIGLNHVQLSSLVFLKDM